MKLLQTTEKLSEGKNLMFYNKNVYECYDQLQEDYIRIYFNEPIPIKNRLIKIINEIDGENNRSLYRLTIAELNDILIKELKHERLIIVFNHFERLTNRTVQIYQNLNSHPNIQFVCSFSHYFQPKLYPFFKEFELVNRKEYEKNSFKNEINLTYAVYIILSVLCFFIYLKAASSLVNAIILLGAAWFALIIFRTFVFIGGRT